MLLFYLFHEQLVLCNMDKELRVMAVVIEQTNAAPPF